MSADIRPFIGQIEAEQVSDEDEGEPEGFDGDDPIYGPGPSVVIGQVDHLEIHINL